MIRTGVALSAIFGLLHLANQSNFVSDFYRPLVSASLRIFGATVSEQGGFFTVGRLNVPWSRDCAGMNVLAILLALCVWTGRHEAFTRRYWLRLALALPVSMIANTARVLTLIAYRQVFYPAVESPQLHYFIGFIWVLPFLGCFIPRSGRSFGLYLLESLYFAAAFSLLAPLVPAPGGSVVALATLVILAQARFRNLGSAPSRAGFVIWLIGGIGIALASMESLWIPWLLLCPNFIAYPIVTSWTGYVLLAGTIPLIAMQPAMGWMVGAALAVCGWRLWRQFAPLQVHPQPPMPLQPKMSGGFNMLLAVVLLSPFFASSISRWESGQARPPLLGMNRQIDPNTYQVRLLGQPPDIELLWFGPQGGGRHHSLPVCMSFRGVSLQDSGVDSAVMTDGQRWMREFFLYRGNLLTTYGQYLQQSFAPWSPVGVHIIASAPVESMTATTFAQTSEHLAKTLAPSRL